MPRTNIRYEDVIADHKAKELERWLKRESWKDVWWVVRWATGVGLVLTGLVWWFS